jgi:hypothetical protein
MEKFNYHLSLRICILRNDELINIGHYFIQGLHNDGHLYIVVLKRANS